MKSKTEKLGKVSITVEKDYWDINKAYKRLTIVERQGTGTGYLSRKAVPVGVDISNRNYWIKFNKWSDIPYEIVQDFGESTEVVISQKVVTLKINELQSLIGEGGSIDERINNAILNVKNELIDGASENVNTFKKVENALNNRYTKEETYNKEEVNSLIVSDENYVTVLNFASLPETGETNTIYRVSNYNGVTSQVDNSVYSEYAWNGTNYIFLDVKTQVNEVFDISTAHNNTKYADLATALGTDGENVPEGIRKGGMSVKFIHSSDNNYVQFRCIADEFTTDTNYWETVNVNRLNQITKSLPSVINQSYLTKMDGCYDATGNKWANNLKNYGFYSYLGTAIPKATLSLKTDAQYGTILYLLKEQPINNQDVVFAGDEQDCLLELNANTEYDILIPESAKYFIFVERLTSSPKYFFPTQLSISEAGLETIMQRIGDIDKSILSALKFNCLGTSSFDVNSLPTGIISFVSTSVPTGLPSGIDYSVGGFIITTRKSEELWSNQDRQFLITDKARFERVYFNGWTNWYGGTFNNIKENRSSAPDINNLKTGINSFVSSTVPSDYPSLNYTQGGLIITARVSDETLHDNDHQYIFAQNGFYTRAYFNGEWQNWYGQKLTNRVIECGSDKEYTTLRSAIESAINVTGTKVIVYPGTYDLTQEFATELENHSGNGLILGNDIHVLFMPGAYVTCLVDVSNEWAYTNFEPFKAASTGNSNFILENANIKCKNTRYCVHDELAGRDNQYIHKYINCTMEQTDENPLAYYTQCIGGGLGQNGYIEVIGGKYKSTSLYYQTDHYTSVDDMQQPISYHNGNNAACDSKIIIKDVYLVDKGYLRFGNYGSSTILTPVFVSGCRMYKPVFLMNETWSSSQVTNFEIISFNNEIVTT